MTSKLCVCVCSVRCRVGKSVINVCLFGRYIAMMPGFLPRLNSKVHFKKGEAVYHPWAPASSHIYKMNGRTMIIIPDRYRRPVEFYETLHESARR